jgi:HSP20 family protein
MDALGEPLAIAPAMTVDCCGLIGMIDLVRDRAPLNKLLTLTNLFELEVRECQAAGARGHSALAVALHAGTPFRPALRAGCQPRGEIMAMVFNDPFESLFNFQQALDSFRRSGWLESSPSGTGPYPPVNVFRKGDDFVIITEVPGVKRSDLNIQVKGNTIRIAGNKPVNYPEKASLHRRERLAGQFDRAVTLPIQVEAEKVNAECRDGILALYLPRAERDKPRSIKVT